MKCGIEIHQRLATNKLFCDCPTSLQEGPVEVTVHRRLHPVLSEMGETDRAALAEAEKQQRFEYEAYRASDCLVETDEEPPHPMNTDAVAIALAIAMQLNALPVNEIHCMRKMVIDGSNTSGFQRTAIVAMNGHLETSQGRVGIPLVVLEEESAGIGETGEGGKTYRLDRLGIPLVEISTAPEIKSAEHAREVAEKIGLMLRATGKVARGIGTIRQDVNVSIENGARVEIKGAQELKRLPQLVENEVRRQRELLKLIEEIKHCVYGREFVGPVEELNSACNGTASKLIAQGLQRGEGVFGFRVEKHAGILGKEINLHRRYATELSEYAKTAGVKGIIHSDEDLKKYGITESEIEKIQQKLNVRQSDAFVMVVAASGTAQKALQKVRERLGMFFVPEETRRTNPDGTSSYMRPLPGRARMYPETDVPPLLLDTAFLARVKRGMGDSLEAKEARLQKLLNSEMAAKMLRSPRLPLFERLANEGIDAMLVASTLENTLIALRREGVEPSEEQIAEALHGCQEGRWVKAAIPEILKEPSKKNELQRIAGKELEKVAQENNFDFPKIMAQYRLRVDATELQEILKFKKLQRA